MGLIRLGDMFLDNRLMSFEDLTLKYQVPKHDLFHFVQLRHYITNNTTLLKNCGISTVERLLFLTSGKTSLSRFYGAVCSLAGDITQRVKTTWKKELDMDIDDETWDDIWLYAKQIYVCTRTREIQFKIIHRFHISPHRRHCFNSSLSPMCLKCKIEIGTLTHCLWSCNRLQRYWALVAGEMEKIFNVHLDLDPVSLLLGIPNGLIDTSAGRKLYNVLTFAARKNILLNWINDKAPSLKG